MLKLNKDTLLAAETVAKVQFEGEYYFSIDDVATLINEDLSGVEFMWLPFKEGQKWAQTKAATIEQIEAGRKPEELSEFNKALLKFKNK
jgi:hypothetical protein